jgi:HlyD family secretion protein
MDLDNYLTGEYPQQLQEAKNSITLAEEELKRSEDKLEWSKKLGDEGFVTRSELEGDRLEVKRRQLNLEVAKSKLNLLEQFTFIRQKEQLESNVYQAEQALIRSEKNAKADLIKAEANLRAKESEYVRQNRKMIENQNQIEKCKIYAPRDGMVIYATSVQRRRLGNDEPLEVGQEVRERQDLIYLPTTSGMKANIKIHETDLRMVSVGMPVVVTVDALNGLEVAGRVAKIAPLPDQGSLWMNPDLKVYETEIYLDTNAPGLRTGMNCRAEVLVKHYEDVVYVPIQSVLEVDKKPTVFIQRKGEPELREVTCGLSSNRVVAILEGVSVGEEILLNPPLSYGELPPSRIMPSDMPLINQGIVEVAQSINVSSSKGDHNSESAKKKKKPKSKDALEE